MSTLDLYGGNRHEYYQRRWELEGIVLVAHDNISQYHKFAKPARKIEKGEIEDCIQQLEIGCENWTWTNYHGDTKKATVPKYFKKRCELEGINVSIYNQPDACRIKVTCEIDSPILCRKLTEKVSVDKVDKPGESVSLFISQKPYRDSFDKVLGAFLKSPQFAISVCVCKFHGLWNDDYYMKRYSVESLGTSIDTDGKKVTLIKTARALRNRYEKRHGECVYDSMDTCIHALEVERRYHHDIFHDQGFPNEISPYFSDKCKLEGIKMNIDNESDDYRTIITFEVDEHPLLDSVESVQSPKTSGNFVPKQNPLRTNKLIDQLRSNYETSCKERNVKLEEVFQSFIVEKLLEASINCKNCVYIQSKDLYAYDDSFEWYQSRCITEDIYIVNCGGCDTGLYSKITYQCNACSGSCGDLKVYFGEH